MKKTAPLILTVAALILAISACAPGPKPAIVQRTQPLITNSPPAATTLASERAPVIVSRKGQKASVITRIG